MVSQTLVPTLRYSQVQPGLYRGAYPRLINFAFLKSLDIKTIVSLIPKAITRELDPHLHEFAQSHGISLVHIECAQSGKGKKRGVPLSYAAVLEALKIMIHTNNAPVYIHCLNGGQVTSLVVACLRRLQFWSSISIFNEFINFTTSITVNDRAFVEGFEGEVEVCAEGKVDWLWAGLSMEVVVKHPKFKVKETQR